MIKGSYINNRNLLGIIRRSCNYVDPRLMDHGFRVSDIIWKILERMGGYTERQIRDVCLLGLIHDIGAYKTEEISRMVQFETMDVEPHEIYGYLFIKYFSPLKELAPCILHHHTWWRDLEGREELTDRQKEISQLLFLADRIDIAMTYEKYSWEMCRERIRARVGVMFAPAIAEYVLDPAFSIVLQQGRRGTPEDWTDFMSDTYSQEEVSGYLMMLVYTIDFRSRHTVTHTVTTTSISWKLSGILGMDEEERNQIACGAVLHDLGKIGIPVEILEYPGRLTPEAMAVMRTHVDITEHIFGGEIDETVARIALRHHEKIDGSGYQKGLRGEELTRGERLVAVADIVSALTGTRSYKESYPKERVVGILTSMKEDGLVDPDIVDALIGHYDEVIEEAEKHCQPLLDRYKKIQEEYLLLRKKSLRNFKKNEGRTSHRL